MKSYLPILGNTNPDVNLGEKGPNREQNSWNSFSPRTRPKPLSHGTCALLADFEICNNLDHIKKTHWVKILHFKYTPYINQAQLSKNNGAGFSICYVKKLKHSWFSSYYEA